MAELEARLADAEETIRAIRNGEVDALVVDTAEGERVFTLEGAETPYRFLVEEMNEGALLLDFHGTVLYANARFAQLANAPLERIIGSALGEFFVAEDQARFPLLLTAAASGFVRQEFRLAQGEGAPRSVGLSLSSMHREQIHGFSVVVTDLTEPKAAEAALAEANELLESRVEERTAQLSKANALLLGEMSERKRTEEELRRQREWLRVTLSSIGDAVIACDQSSRITFLNPVAGELCGWDPEEAKGQTVSAVFKIIDERTQEPLDDIVAQVLREERVLGLQNHTLLVSRDGREIPIDDSAAPIVDADGKLIGVVLVFQDVTQRRRAEDASRRSHEELEAQVAERTAKLQKMVGELQHVSYSIVHDMRAPLRAMQGFAAFLGEATDPEERSTYCRRIVDAGKRIDMQITDALHYTKAVLQELPLEPVDLAKLLHTLVETYPNLQPEKADILTPTEIPSVMGNESLLTQCFSNLLGNAVKFVPRDTKARVRIRVDSAEPQPALMRIWIEDNGIGIPKYAQKRLFRMFERLNRGYEGTGMGLAIVRKVVERMGGNVGVESEEGKGSRFWVELKRAPGDTQADPAARGKLPLH